MSETQIKTHSQIDASDAVPTPSAQDEMAKTNALIAYGLMVIGLFTGIFWFIGAVWAMIKISDARGTMYEDHYSNIITTFWWGLGLSLICVALAVSIAFFVSYLIMPFIWIWSIYRIVKGVARITSNKGYR